MSLREFLSGFHLPGEAQCIDRLMEVFATQLFQQWRALDDDDALREERGSPRQQHSLEQQEQLVPDVRAQSAQAAQAEDEEPEATGGERRPRCPFASAAARSFRISNRTVSFGSFTREAPFKKKKKRKRRCGVCVSRGGGVVGTLLWTFVVWAEGAFCRSLESERPRANSGASLVDALGLSQATADAAFVLAFSTIMLQTDLLSPAKGKKRKIPPRLPGRRLRILLRAARAIAASDEETSNSCCERLLCVCVSPCARPRVSRFE